MATKLVQWWFNCLIVLKFSFIKRLSRKTMTSFSHLALSPSHHQKFYMTLHEMTFEIANV